MILLRPSRKIIVPQVYDGSGSIVTIAANPTQELSAQSALVGAIITGGGPVASPIMFTHCDSAATNGIVMRFAYSAAVSTFRLQADSTGTAQAPVRISTNTIADGVYSDIAFTWDGGLTASNIHLYYSRNGSHLLEASYGTTTNGTTAIKGPAGQPITIGNRPGAARPFQGSLFYVARWNRVLSLVELEMARANGPLSVSNGLTMFRANGRDYGPHGLQDQSWSAVPYGASNIYAPGILKRLWYGVDFASTTAYTLTVNPASITLTGSSITLRADRNLPVAPGSFAATGATAGTRADRNLPITAGAMTFTGGTIALRADRALLVAPGAFTFAGDAVTLTHGYALAVVPAVVTFSSSTVGLTHGYALAVAPGSFSLTGADVALRADRLLPVAAGAITFAGADIVMQHGVPGAYVLNAQPSVVTFVGASIGLAVNRRLQVSPGAFSVVGASLSMRADRSLDVDPGSILFAGSTLTLTWSGVPMPDAGFVHSVSEGDRTYRVDGNRTYLVPPR